jgi:hypothetical protein
MRATIEQQDRLGKQDSAFPPINVNVVLGQENLSIKVYFNLRLQIFL